MTTKGVHRVRRSGGTVVLIAAAAVVALLAGGTVGYVRVSTEPSDELPIPAAYYGSAHAVCGLLDNADVAIVMGEPYRDGGAPISMTLPFSGIPGVTKCAFTSEKQHEAAQGVEIGVVYAYAEQIFDEFRKGSNRQPVPRVGERAMWYPGSGELLVLARDKIVGVFVPHALHESPQALIERSRRLASKAVARIGQRRA